MTYGDKLWLFRTFCQPEASETVDTQRQIMVILHLLSSRGGEPDDMQRNHMVILHPCIIQRRRAR